MNELGLFHLLLIPLGIALCVLRRIHKEEHEQQLKDEWEFFCGD